jgi:hypothetical protein
MSPMRTNVWVSMKPHGVGLPHKNTSKRPAISSVIVVDEKVCNSIPSH